MAYQTELEIAEVVRGFESCQTEADAFTHTQHLLVAAWYLRDNAEEAAVQNMREGLLRFLSHHRVTPGKYNETITRFWVKQMKAQLNGAQVGDASWCETVGLAVSVLSDSRLIFQHYTPELLNSEAARCSWIDGDLKSLG